MLIKINQSDLIKSINIVIKAISTKTTLPILECIVIKTVENGIFLTRQLSTLLQQKLRMFQMECDFTVQP